MGSELGPDTIKQEARMHLGRNAMLAIYVSIFASVFALGGKEIIDAGVDLLGLDAEASGAAAAENASNLPAVLIGIGGGFVGMAAWFAAISAIIIWRFGNRRGGKVARRFF